VNHPFAQRQLSRRHPEHTAKGARQVRRIRETGGVGRLGRGRAVDQVASRTLEAKPQDVRSEWNADGIGERMHEARRREADVGHAEAFEPMPAGDPSGDLMNRPKKYVVSKTLNTPIWRDTTIVRENAIDFVRALKKQPGKDIFTDGSSQLVHALLAHDLVDELHLSLYPLSLGSGKRALPDGMHAPFTMASATPYPTGVVALQYVRQR
jgi:dihydrofolate reductase